MADTLVVCLNSEIVQWVIQWSAYSGNLIWHCVLSLFPVTAASFICPALGSWLGNSLAFSQILQWTRQQNIVQHSVRFVVCRFTQGHLPHWATVLSKALTAAHSECHYISQFASALTIPSLVVQIMQYNKTSWKWEINRHQKLVSVTLAVWKLNDNTPHRVVEIYR